MKNFLAFAALTLFAGTALAWPNIGDTVNYNLTALRGTQSINGTMTVTTTSMNPTSDVLTQSVLLNIGGRTKSSVQTQKLSEYKQLAQMIPTLVLQCSSQGGVNETVQTSAGTFSACKLPTKSSNSTGFIWVANVTDGWVKATSTNSRNGQVTNAVLVSFKEAVSGN